MRNHRRNRGGQHPGHQQDESQSQRKEFRLNQREHDAMPTLDYHNCTRLIIRAVLDGQSAGGSGADIDQPAGHGGQLSACSKQKSGGALFQFTLPIQSAARRAAP
jgi:hypothetical protein